MAAFAGKLNIIFGADTTELEKKIKDVNKSIKALGKKLTDTGKGLSLLTSPLMAVGTAAFGVGVKIEKAFRNIKVGTGATGAALKGLQADFKAIAVLGPQSFDDSAKAIADLNTMTGASGKTLQDLSMAVLDASRMTETSLDGMIKGLGQLMNNWGLSAEQGVSVMNKLFVASQNTGLGMDAIAQGVAKAGGGLRGMGLSLDEAIALMGNLDKAGLDAQTVLNSMAKALFALNREGIKDTSEGLKMVISSIKEAATMEEALKIGQKLFEVETGSKLTIAIREGKFEFEELAKALKNAKTDIQDTSRETMTLGERWSTVGNQFAIALEPLGTKLVKMAEEYIPDLNEVIGDFALNLDDGTIKILALVAAIGPAVLALGAFAGSISTIITVGGTLITVLMGPAGLVVALGAVATAIYNKYAPSLDYAQQKMIDVTGAALMTKEALVSLGSVDLGNIANLEVSGGDVSIGGREALPVATENLDTIKTTAQEAVKPVNEVNKAVEKAKAQAEEIKKILANMGKGGGGGGGKKKGGGGGGAKSGKSALDLFVQDVQDRIKYFKEDGNAYMEKIDAMQAKTKPLTDDWKKLQDLRLSIDDSAFSVKLQKIQDEIKYLDRDGAAFVPELQKMLEGLDPLSEKWKRVQDVITNITESGYSERWGSLAWEFSEGLLSAADYARMLEVEIAELTEGTDKWRARFSELQNIKASEISKLLDSLSHQFESGKLSNVEYEVALAGIVSQFKEFPRAAKMAMEALEAFQKQSELTTVSVGQQLQEALKQTTKDFNEMWGKGIEGAIDGFLEASIRGGDFGASLRKLGEDIVFTTLKMLILKQIMGMFGMGGGGAGLGAGLDIGAWNAGFSFPTFANGGAFSHGHLVPFARGGVVHRPTIFPMATGAGLMCERGPEAVMPLERDSHGRLGVVASGAAMEAPSVTVNVINESSQPVTATQTGPAFDEQMRQMVVGVILRDQATNGPITQNFRRR